MDSTFDKINVKKLRDKKNSAYVADLGETDKDGVTSFFACFDKEPPKCELSASGKRDGFRKVTFFSDPSLDWSNLSAKYERRFGKPSLRAYVSVKDCSSPKLFIESTYRGTNWLFLQEIGLMLDASIVVTRNLSISQINRENTHEAVSESVHVELNNSEIETLRRLSASKQVLIRFTGKNSFVSLDSESTRSFLEGLSRLILIHDNLQLALKNVNDVKDSACPE
jgi:hypothetical protein